MTQAVDQSERATQDRVVAQLQKHLGYRYLGNWAARPNNGPIENAILTAWLQARGVSPTLIGKTLHQLGQTAALGEGKNL